MNGYLNHDHGHWYFVSSSGTWYMVKDSSTLKASYDDGKKVVVQYLNEWDLVQNLEYVSVVSML